MALELGLGTLPCSTECDMEPKPTPTPLPMVLGPVKPQAGVGETGLSSLAEITEEQGGSCTFAGLLSDHLKCKHWNGFRSLIPGSHQSSAFAVPPRDGKASLLFAGGNLGLLVPTICGEEVVQHH